jgi:uncharacterized membrane protein
VNFETTVEINAPLDTVWEILVDVDRWPEWTRSISAVKRLDEGAVGVGSRVRIKQPRMTALVWQVAEFEPGVSFTWRTASLGVTIIGTHRLTRTNDERVSVTFGIRQSGALAPMIALLTAARTKRYVQMEADGLKRRAEDASAAPDRSAPPE